MFKKFIILSLLSLSIQSVIAEDDIEYSLEYLIDSYNSYPIKGKEDAKKTFANANWLIINRDNESTYYANYNYVNANNPNQPEAWTKIVVEKDLTKDGLGVGDFKMMLMRFNCSSKTYTPIKYTEYNKKTGTAITDFDFPSYTQAKVITPETVGDSQLKWACFYSHIKNN